MSRIVRLVGLAALGLAAVVGLTWALEHVIPAPFSGFLALAVVGVAGTEIVKRQPRHRAERMLRIYLHARERGADEADARRQLMAKLHAAPATRQLVAAAVEAKWTGESEKARVVAGVAALLDGEGRRLAEDAVGAVYDRTRDRFKIPGWEALPAEFVTGLRSRLDERALADLDRLTRTYRLFEQKFFGSPSSLGADPPAAIADFARLLTSVGNRIAKDHPGDAERAYRLSLSLRPEPNLAHAGLAILLADTGRSREAEREARLALDVLDAHARRTGDDPPAVEDIFPFRSPAKLREALERLASGQ